MSQCTPLTDNISDEDMAHGCDLYCHYGTGDLKNKAVISVNTVFERVSTFYKMQMRAHYAQPSFAHVLLRMHRTGPDAGLSPLLVAGCKAAGQMQLGS